MEYETLTRNKDDVSESGETCLPANCCFSELALKNPTKHVGLVQSRYPRHVIVCKLFSP
jgi:hypothetical protein